MSELPRELSSKLFAAAIPRRIAAGEALFRFGDHGDGCYRIDQGLVKISIASPSGGERILAILSKGAILGELSLIDGQPRSASAFAITDCACQFIRRSAFQQCVQENPNLYEALVNILAQRLRAANETIAAASFLNTNARLARALLELSERIGCADGDGRIVLKHSISRSDLAAMAGVACENVSRTLSEWRRRKIVTKQSKYYLIEDVAALRREMESETLDDPTSRTRTADRLANLL